MESLPDAVLAHTLSFLNCQDVLTAAAAVSRRWSALVRYAPAVFGAVDGVQEIGDEELPRVVRTWTACKTLCLDKSKRLTPLVAFLAFDTVSFVNLHTLSLAQVPWLDSPLLSRLWVAAPALTSLNLSGARDVDTDALSSLFSSSLRLQILNLNQLLQLPSVAPSQSAPALHSLRHLSLG